MEKKIIPFALLVLSLASIPLLENNAFAEVQNWYSNPSENTSLILESETAQNNMIGELVNTEQSILYGKAINQVTIKLSKTGSPAGSFYVGVWGNTSAPTNANYKYLISTNSTSILSITAVSYTFFNPNTSYTLTTGDVVGIFYNSGSSGNVINVRVMFQNPDGVIDGTNSIESNYNSATNNWVGNDNFDLTGIISYNTATSGSGGSPSGGATNGMCNNGTALECVGDRSLVNTITGAPDVTTSMNTLFVSVGLVNATNTDITTNGTGIILMLATGTFFATAMISTIALVNSRFGANIQYSSLPKEIWLFIVVGAVGLAFYMGWIGGILFYSMVIGIVGLFVFGLYKQYNGGG